MIAIYPYRYNGKHDHELRYSLRSLATHAKWCDGVLLVGSKPDWYTGHHIGHDGPDEKLKNVQEKLAIACAAMDQEWWVLINDDFFIARDQHECPLYTSVPISESWHEMGGRYREVLRDTELIVGSKFPSFELHCPLPVATTYMRAALELCQGRAAHRTVFGWLSHDGEWGSQRRYDDTAPPRIGRFAMDRKIHNEFQVEENMAQDWFSTKDSTSGGVVLERLRARFPEPSPWEQV